MTPSEFKTAFPEFVSESDATVQRQIDAAPPYFDVARWGALYSDGVGYFVAHRIAVSHLPATFGVGSSSSTSDTVGRVKTDQATSFSGNTSRNPWLLTRYGKQYLDLRDEVGMGAVAV